MTEANLLFPFGEYWWFYASFIGFVLLMLIIDLGIFNKKAHEISFAEAGIWSLVWVTLAMIFSGVLFYYSLHKFQDQELAREVSLQFLTGYVIEKSLSVDNIFVFVVVFSFFGIPARYQHRVLFFGILGALVFRAIFISLGALLMRYSAVIWIFGAFLIFTGIKMIFSRDQTMDPADNWFLRFLKKHLRVTHHFHEEHFFVKEGAFWLATPLFISLVFLEFTDIIFAVDSVPAIFAITNEPLLVFTSNIFAILGLRSLYFLLAGVVDKFHLLKYGLAAVLIFVGLKMVWLNDLYDGHFPILLSLAIILAFIGGSILASLIFPPKKQ